jgi:hypothetical protein
LLYCFDGGRHVGGSSLGCCCSCIKIGSDLQYFQFNARAAAAKEIKGKGSGAKQVYTGSEWAVQGWPKEEDLQSAARGSLLSREGPAESPSENRQALAPSDFTEEQEGGAHQEQYV